MNYPVVSIETAGEELNRLHGEIEGKMRSTVQDAIRAGEILSNVKEKLRHGDFLPWIKINCRFSQQSASNYIRLFEHADKLPTVGNLQEAYKQVETLEAQARQSEEQKAKMRVSVFIETGDRPDGWRRGTDDKLAAELSEREARIKKMQEDLKRETEKPKQELPPPQFDRREIERFSEKLTASLVKREKFKQRIRISSEADEFTDALMDYLEELADDNRRIEACYNIIKVCKGIANQLQTEGAK